VCLARLRRLVLLVQSVAELLLSLGCSGGGADGSLPSLHALGSLCMIGLVLLSLLKCMAHHFL